MTDFPTLAEATESLTAIEWNLPRTPLGWAAVVGVGAALLAWTVWLYVRDTRTLPRVARVFLLACRVGVLVCLAVIACDPRERTQTTAVRPSRVAVLVDRSQSMRFPAADPRRRRGGNRRRRERDAGGGRAAGAGGRGSHRSPAGASRGAGVRLRRRRRAGRGVPEAGAAGGIPGVRPGPPRPPPRPCRPPRSSRTGPKTRLGEAVADALRQARGPTLAGVVALTDGGQNAGAGPDAAAARAARDGVPLLAVGVGGTEPPADVRVTDVAAPSDVRYSPERDRQDPFEVRAFLAADGLAGKSATVTLARADADAPPPAGDAADAAAADGPVVETRTLPLPADGETLEVRFEREPSEAGRFRYTVRLAPPPGTRQVRDDDDSRSAVVTVRSRPTAVLLIAGGPNRDYRFPPDCPWPGRRRRRSTCCCRASPRRSCRA